MPSSRSPWRSTTVALVFGGLGILFVAGPLLSTELRADRDATLLVAVGALMLCVSLLACLQLAPASSARTALAAQTGGPPAIRIGLRPHLPFGILLIGLSGANLFVVWMLRIGLTEGGLLLSPFLVLFASLVPDAVRALLRGPHVLLAPSHVDFRGWGIDARLAWEDVVGAEIVTPLPRRPVVRIQGRAGAASWRCRRSRIVWPLDLRPHSEHVDVPLLALDHPGRLTALAHDLLSRDEEGRRAMLDEDGVAFLDGTMTT